MIHLALFRDQPRNKLFHCHPRIESRSRTITFSEHAQNYRHHKFSTKVLALLSLTGETKSPSLCHYPGSQVCAESVIPVVLDTTKSLLNEIIDLLVYENLAEERR
jgi:hypothetical protein